MILLDTNVLSALMRTPQEQAVISWLDQQPPESVWTTSITVFEVRFGLRLLATGRRRHRLEEAFEQSLAEDLERRVADFDITAAEMAAEIAADRRRAGSPVEIRDLQIAGIARARRAALATRNRRHFQGFGLDLVDPWSA
ncbi:MAG: PIN domain-containing protein [Thermoanaerobaculia bacterium]|nr:PIN domain-containing protein [Thermoanaerobaculia bacterium]